jgi:hypothetical protein
MKSTFAGFVLVTVAALSGCNQSDPAGPVVTSAKPVLGPTDNSFTLNVPEMSSSLQRGSQQDITIGIERTANFDEDVTLTFANVPEGVTIEPASPVIKSGDQDAKIAFTARDGSPLGDVKLKIIGHPTNGKVVENELSLNIKAKDTFTLSVPRLAPSLIQGETQMVSIGIKRDETFDQDIALTFGDLPTGVTLEPAAPVINRGDAEVQVAFTASDDASLGDFDVKVTGHPTEGTDASSEFKLMVTEK